MVVVPATREVAERCSEGCGEVARAQEVASSTLAGGHLVVYSAAASMSARVDGILMPGTSSGIAIMKRAISSWLVPRMIEMGSPCNDMPQVMHRCDTALLT